MGERITKPKFNDGDISEAWYFLNNHPKFREYPDVIGKDFKFEMKINTKKVSPSTGDVDLDDDLNTKSLIVLEANYTKVIGDCRVYTGMYRLRSQGETFEEALIELANLTYYFHGDSRFGDSEQDEYLKELI